MLNCRHHLGAERRADRANECGILVVLDNWDDTLSRCSVGWSVIVVIRSLDPTPGRGVNSEAQNGLLSSPSQALVDPTYLRARGVVDREERARRVSRNRCLDIEDAPSRTDQAKTV